MTNILQNQKKSNFLKPHKEQALKDIQISIEEWNKFQEKNFFYQIFSKQKKFLSLGDFKFHVKSFSCSP
ncbi:MAG: hypothetical protein CM15mP40_12530 [Alphaproteobacteria bacterium]|nr:MAG: hypothetical protein CM15mP40_12530 [Alphaproteobacteria bacterium]